MVKDLEIYKDAVNKDTGFIHNNNFEVIDVDDNYAVMEAKITEESKNLYGIVHGGFLFGLADSVCGLACLSTGRNAVTVDASINYLHAAKGSKLRAEASAIKIGNNISTYEEKIYDDKGVLVAISTVNYYYIN